MARLPILALAATLGCGSTAREGTPQAAPAATSSTASTQLAGYPWQRLVVEGNPVEPLALELPEGALRELGVKSHRSFTATSPAIWLLAFEFADQPTLLAAEPRVLALLGDDRPPFARKTSHTGAWLLVAGFPTAGDPSPELDHARMTFLDGWAGEE